MGKEGGGAAGARGNGTPGGHLTFAAVVRDTRDSLRANARYIPRTAWPALVVYPSVELADVLFAGVSPLFFLLEIPALLLVVMAISAWYQIVLLGPQKARTGPFGWRRPETACLLYTILEAAAVGGAVLALLALVPSFTTPSGLVPGPSLPATHHIATAAVYTVLTPIMLLVPARTIRASARTRSFYRDWGNLAVAFQVWASVLVLPYPLWVALDAVNAYVVAEATGPLAKGLLIGWSLLDTALFAIVGYINLTATAAMARQLGGWTRPH